MGKGWEIGVDIGGGNTVGWDWEIDIAADGCVGIGSEWTGGKTHGGGRRLEPSADSNGT